MVIHSPPQELGYWQAPPSNSHSTARKRDARPEPWYRCVPRVAWVSPQSCNLIEAPAPSFYAGEKRSGWQITIYRYVSRCDSGVRAFSCQTMLLLFESTKEPARSTEVERFMALGIAFIHRGENTPPLRGSAHLSIQRSKIDGCAQLPGECILPFSHFQFPGRSRAGGGNTPSVNGNG